MASIRDIRSRIKSISETKKITRAMNLIASAKFKNVRKQLNDTLPYFEKIQSTVRNILYNSENIDYKYVNTRSDKKQKKVIYLVITGDKGLCGSYNNNVIKFVEGMLRDEDQNRILAVGNVGRNAFRLKGKPLDKDFFYPSQNPTMRRTRDIAITLLSLFDSGEADEIYVVYTKMVSALRQEPTAIKLLPLDQDEIIHEGKNAGAKNTYTVSYDPSPISVLDALIPIYVKGVVFGSLVESFSSEQSARMTAMDSATKNADEMISELTLLYNRARQANITQEISEIIGGAASLSQ